MSSPSSEAARDAAFDEVVERADAYAVALAHLHEKLREARVAHLAAQQALEVRYALLSTSCVPQEHHASRVVTVNAKGNISGLTTRELPPPLPVSTDMQPTASDDDDAEETEPKEGHAHKTQETWASAASEEMAWRRDPVTWFSTAPPLDLRRAQAAFSSVLEAAVETALLRQRVLDTRSSSC